MRKDSCKILAFILVGMLCFLCSCSKDAYSGEEQSSAVQWDSTAYDVSYIMTVTTATSTPVTDKYFDLKLALENSEKPQKVLCLSCKNYLYGEKVDLATNKYSSKIEFTDGRMKYSIYGGASEINSGSYYVLTRKGNHIDLVINLSYSGENGYVHKLKVKYGGELPEKVYLPSENWQNEPSAHYSFTYDEAQYRYTSYVFKDNNSFMFEIANEKEKGKLDVYVKNMKLGEKMSPTDLRLILSNEAESRVWSGDAILDGSYVYAKSNGAFNYEVTLDAKCKDDDGTVHHIQAEYNVYR